MISLFSSNLKATDATESLFYTVVSQEQWTEHIFGSAWALSGQWKCDDKSFMRFWTLCTWVHPFRSVILTFPYVNTWFCDLLIFAKYFWIVQSYPLDYFLFYAISEDFKTIGILHLININSQQEIPRAEQTLNVKCSGKRNKQNAEI